MARSRNIKPGFFMNDELAEIEPLGRLLFAGLWCIADREGRLEDRPKRIKAEVLPYDDCDVDYLLNQLAKYDFIIRYEVDNELYIQVSNFSKHQNPHKNEAPSTIPAPDDSSTSTVQIPELSGEDKPANTDLMGLLNGSGTSTVQAPDKHNTNPADSLNMIPDSLNMIDDHYNQEAEKLEHELGGSRELYQVFEKEFGRPLSPFEVETLGAWTEEFSPELIQHALKIAILGQNRSFRYIQGILNRWQSEGVRCVQDVEVLNKKHEQQKKAAHAGNNRASPKTAEDKNRTVDQFFGLEETDSG